MVIPYEFDAYQEVSETIYRILLQHAAIVQPMSCDEAYLDVTGCTDPIQLAEQIRRKIRDATRCNASVGIGPNILLANMATKKAKPNGVFQIQPKVPQQLAHFANVLLPCVVCAHLLVFKVSCLAVLLCLVHPCICAKPELDVPAPEWLQDVDEFLLHQSVSALPGVGWSCTRKLQEMGVHTIAQLRVHPVADLQQCVGAKSAEDLVNFSHGRDDRQVRVQPGFILSLQAHSSPC